MSKRKHGFERAIDRSPQSITYRPGDRLQRASNPVDGALELRNGIGQAWASIIACARDQIIR